MKGIKVIISGILLALAMISCKKDDTTNQPPPLSPIVQSLTGGSVKTWKTSSIKLVNGNSLSMDSCRKDNRYEFSVNNKAYKFTNGMQCDSTEKQSFTGTWEWTNADLWLVLTGSNVNVQWEKMEITDSKFVVKYRQGELNYEETLSPQ